MVSHYSTYKGSPTQYITNNYWLAGSGASYGAKKGSSNTNSGAASISSANLKNYAGTLGSEYKTDTYNINSEYPILWWQEPRLELDKNQVYIKAEESLKLNLSASENYEEVLGMTFNITDFNWVSTNEDVAIVDSQGNVKGLTDRIYNCIC